MSTTFEKTPHRTVYRRRINDGDRVILAMIAFAVALGLILLGAYLRSDAAGADNELPALSAGYGVIMQADRPASLGVGAPGKPAHAVESILRASPRRTATWCGLGGTGALQRLATTVATKPQAGPRCSFSKFPGVTGFIVGGAGVSCARESDTAVVEAQAAPGRFLVSVRSTVHIPCATSPRLIADARRGMTRPDAHHSFSGRGHA